MRFLLDTHLLLWAAIHPERLSPTARDLIGDSGHEPVFSVVSLWEAAIKRGLDRPDFDVDPRRLRTASLASGYAELTVTAEHAFAVQHLPSLHRDPFDRLLIAQATVEGVWLLTADHRVAAYPGPVRQV